MSPVRRRLLVALLALLLAAGGAVLALPRLYFSDGTDWSQVVSIEKSPDYQNPELLQRALALPVAALYQKGGLEYQRNGSFCGPTSAVDLAHSLGASATQADVLDGTPIHSTLGFVFGGLTLDDEAALIRARLGKPVTVLRDLDLAAFRRELQQTNDLSRRYLVNLHRGPLFGRGGGHHSPIGGYLAAEDLVLVLDVNAKYQPWLVKSERLFQAIDTVDRQTGKKRGLLRVDALAPHGAPGEP
jgi:Phytochelatin synthase